MESNYTVRIELISLRFTSDIGNRTEGTNQTFLYCIYPIILIYLLKYGSTHGSWQQVRLKFMLHFNLIESWMIPSPGTIYSKSVR